MAHIPHNAVNATTRHSDCCGGFGLFVICVRMAKLKNDHRMLSRRLKSALTEYCCLITVVSAIHYWKGRTLNPARRSTDGIVSFSRCIILRVSHF